MRLQAYIRHLEWALVSLRRHGIFVTDAPVGTNGCKVRAGRVIGVYSLSLYDANPRW